MSVPELWFKVAWPDGNHEICYSPSTVIREHLQVGQVYPLGEFVDRARTALQAASARVAAKYGYRCTSAEDQLERIEATARQYADDPGATVTVLALQDRSDKSGTEAPA